MTLNITLLTSDEIYQSADFRLSYPQTSRPPSDRSMKLVSLQYSDFFGMLTYTGIGAWEGRDTSLWVTGWLEGIGDASLRAVVEGLAEEATRWMSGIRRRQGRSYLHTFVMASFSDGDANATVISNFEDSVGRANQEPNSEFSISFRKSGGRPSALVTGWKPAVERHQRRALERFARRHVGKPQAIRFEMSRLNEEAAHSKEGGSISSGCTVVSMSRDGSGFQDLTPGSAITIRQVMHGMPLPDLSQFFQSEGVGEVAPVGGSFARSTPGTQQQRRKSPCILVAVDDSMEKSWEAAEISKAGFETSTALSINSNGVVLGAGTYPERPSENHLWRWSELNDVTVLPLPSCENLGAAINDADIIAGTGNGSDGHLHSFSWSGDLQLILDNNERDSGSRAINDSGIIAGWVCLSSEDRGQSNYRPAVWRGPDDASVLSDIPGLWGEAIGIDEAGDALLWLHEQMLHRGSAALLLASGELKELDRIPGGIVPIGMASNQEILAFCNYKDGPLALLLKADHTWQPLGTRPGWLPGAISRRGWISGSVRHRGFDRPWVRRPTGEVTLLPYFRHHHCRPVAINDDGMIAGHAFADHGTHAVLWRASS